MKPRRSTVTRRVLAVIVLVFCIATFIRHYRQERITHSQDVSKVVPTVKKKAVMLPEEGPFSRDISRVGITQTENQVDLIMGPPVSSAVEHGLTDDSWRLFRNDGIYFMSVIYETDGRAGWIQTDTHTDFGAYSASMIKKMGKPVLDEKNRKAWKIKDRYCIIQNYYNGSVSTITCTEQMYKIKDKLRPVWQK